MGSATLTDPLNPTDTIILKREDGGRIPVQNVARVPALDVPGASGDRVQFLGRKSRVVTIERGVFYAMNARATELSLHTLIGRWLDNGTVLVYKSDLYPAGFNVNVRSYTPVDGESPTGLRYNLVLIESDLAPNGGPILGYVLGAAFTIIEAAAATTGGQAAVELVSSTASASAGGNVDSAEMISSSVAVVVT